MPRIFTSSNVPLDFCVRCFPSEKTALKRYNDFGEGPDGRGNCFDYDADHPDYDQHDYTCTTCKCLLTAEHNWMPA